MEDQDPTGPVTAGARHVEGFTAGALRATHPRAASAAAAQDDLPEVSFTPDEITVDPILQFFTYAHLPAHLRGASRIFAAAAAQTILHCPRSAERTVALRKLLEAKDAAVRAVVAAQV